MSIEIQMNAVQLLVVEGVKLTCAFNGTTDSIRDCINNNPKSQMDLGELVWLTEADTFINFPMYDYSRSYSSMVWEGKVWISCNAGSASEFRTFAEQFCKDHSIEYKVV